MSTSLSGAMGKSVLVTVDEILGGTLLVALVW